MSVSTVCNRVDVQKLIDANDALLRRMAELGIEAANVAAALTSRGAPAPDAFVQELADLGRLFAALRSEAFEAAACLTLPLPPLETVKCAADLKTMLGALRISVLAAERQANVTAARESALNILDRIALLAHVDHGLFEPLQACQEQARRLRAVLEQQSREPDVEATTRFAELLTFIDRHRDLDDQKWGVLQQSITDAFGAPLAMAAGRGRLVSQQSSS